MKKEFIVSKIENAQNGSPNVLVILTDTRRTFSATGRQQEFPENPFSVAAIHIGSLDDLKNLPKKISDVIERVFHGDSSDIPTDSTAFKMNSSEYEALGIKKGDKVTLELKIANTDIEV